jgi:hypothetical protein
MLNSQSQEYRREGIVDLLKRSGQVKSIFQGKNIPNIPTKPGGNFKEDI